MIIAALTAAILWDLGTWYFGIPSSTSHTLMGGLAGAVVAHAGFGALHMQKLEEIAAFIVISPVLGFIVAMVLILTILWICRSMAQRKVNVAFRKLQLLSASAMAFTHGQNDAQKAMGVICLALIIYGKLAVVARPPGGRAPLGEDRLRQHDGPGHRQRRLADHPDHGPPDRQAAPHPRLRRRDRVGPGAVHHRPLRHPGLHHPLHHRLHHGRGRQHEPSAVRWGVAGNIVVAWLLTIPCSFLIAAVALKLIHPFFH